LDLPVEVQRAVSSGSLPMTDALKVADAAEQVQQEIVEQIRSGRPAKQVIRERVRPRGRLVPSPHGVYRSFLGQLDRTVDLLDGRVDEIAGTALPAEQALRILEKSERLIAQLRAEVTRRIEGDGIGADDD